MHIPDRFLTARVRGATSGTEARSQKSELTMVRSKKQEGLTDDCQKTEEDKLHR
jgi:hypothetical protein